MKTRSETAAVQRKLYAAGFGLYFSVAFFLGFSSFLFQPLTNEFYSIIRVAFFLTAFALGAAWLPGRKSSWESLEWIIFLILLNFFLLLLCWKKPDPFWHILLFFLLTGHMAGHLRRKVFFPKPFYSSCTGGFAAGIMTFWGLALHAGNVPLLRGYLPLMIFFLLSGVFFFISPKPKHSVAGKLLLIFCWMAAAGQFLWWNQSGRTHPPAPAAEKHELEPAMIAQAGLQPGRKNLKILFIGDSENAIRQLSEFPLTRKLVTVSLCAGNDLYRKMNSEADDCDLIVFTAPMPDSLYAERLYSIRFYQLLKDHLAPGGALALWFPDKMLCYRKNHILQFYGRIGAILKNVFPVVKPTGEDSMLLLCGDKNITNSPDELNALAQTCLAESNYLPAGAFLINTQEEQLEHERLFRTETLQALRDKNGIQNSLMKTCIVHHPRLDRTFLGNLLRLLQRIFLPILIVLTVLIWILRYFYSGGVNKKRFFLTWENGLYNGLLMMLFLIPYQQSTGRLFLDWIPLTGLFALSGFCGMIASAGRQHSPLLLKLLLALTLLLPICGLSFLHGYPSEPLIFYVVTAYAGYTAGTIFSDVQSEMPILLTGSAAGLLTGVILYWLPGGMVFAVIAAILCRIPPLAAENLQKQFEKRGKTYNIY